MHLNVHNLSRLWTNFSGDDEEWIVNPEIFTLTFFSSGERIKTEERKMNAFKWVYRAPQTVVLKENKQFDRGSVVFVSSVFFISRHTET